MGWPAIIYLILAYWAAGETIYANTIRIGTANNLFLRRLIAGAFLGFILIPIAVLKLILGGKH